MPADQPLPPPGHPPAPAAIDDTATLYSILVPGGTESYARLGAPDGKAEGRLPPDPAKPDQPGHDTSSPFDPGILLYTTGTIEQVARALVTHTTDKLELRGSDFGLSAANWSTAMSAGFLAQASFQRGQFGAVTVGAAQDTVVGSRTDMVLGQFAQLTTGRLNANYGAALNLYAGQVVDLRPDGVEVQGPGRYSAELNRSIVAGKTLTLVSGDVDTAAIIKRNGKLATGFKIAMGSAAVVAAAEAAAIAVVPWAGSDSEDRRDATLRLMTATAALSGGITAAVTLIQAMGLLLSLILKKQTHDAAQTQAYPMLKMDGSRIELRLGNGSIAITEPEQISIEVGKAKINLFEDKILISIDDTGITMTDSDIYIAASHGFSVLSQEIYGKFVRVAYDND